MDRSSSNRIHSRRAGVLCAALVALALGGCGDSSSSSTGGGSTAAHANATSATSATSAGAHRAPTSARPAEPVVLRASAIQGIVGWTPVGSVRGRVAVWLARVPGAGEPITMLRFDQSLLKLALHSGSVDPGGSGWRYGASIGTAERRKVVAGFEGGFKFTDGVGGFFSQGRPEARLTGGLASIVTYTSGISDIGAWNREVPVAGRAVFSVRQNLHLLVDRGRAADNVTSCVITCWGPTLGGGLDSARGALGIDASARLVYAGGERLSVSALANALVGAGVQRAAELDINPEWVNLYLYAHHRAGGVLGVIPMIPGQSGIPGQLLAPYSRDFFTIDAR